MGEPVHHVKGPQWLVEGREVSCVTDQHTHQAALLLHVPSHALSYTPWHTGTFEIQVHFGPVHAVHQVLRGVVGEGEVQLPVVQQNTVLIFQ